MSGRKPKVAMVVQRCGLEVNGGAELACLEVAREMSATWDVTIVTTCALEHQTWKDHYDAGETVIDGVKVLRFPVDRTRSRFFNALSERALRRGSDQTGRELDEWMKAQGPYSSRLLRYVKQHRNDYDVWFFFTYLYATTYFALPLVADRSVLIPFAHDEWPIHLPGWSEFFRLPRQMIFSTHEEREFMRKRFAALDLKGEVVGVGIHPPDDVRADSFRHRFGVLGPYAVYVGRIEPAKSCDVLLRNFTYYKHQNGDDFHLLMLGREAMKVPNHPWLRLLGFVDEETKYEAMRGAQFVVAPSALESLSLVLLEAWSQERPVLVNAASDVMVGQCRRANGGLWYADEQEFASAVPMLRRPEIAASLGASGRDYWAQNYSWSRIHQAYQRVYDEVAAARR